MRNEFVLFKRKGQRAYYFYFYRGNKRVTKTTGKTGKIEAKRYAENFLKKYQNKKKDILFKDFAEGFFIWDSCLWIKKQIAFKRQVSKTWAKSKRAILVNYLVPHFGDFFLHEITRADIEGFLVDLKRSEQTKNHILHTFRQIMREAEDQGIIEYSIAERVRGFSVQHKQRGIFTLDELKILFPDDENNMLNIWRDVKHVALFLILASTGARSGEARGLFWEDYLPQYRALFIQRAVKDEEGSIGETKTREKRLVLLSGKADSYLGKWRGLSQYTGQHDLLFYGDGPKMPYTRRALAHSLGQALKRAGIEKADRTTHSFRHSFNTLFRSLLPDEMLRRLTGHKTDKMTNHYDNPGIEEYLKRVEPARAAIEGLF
jgi:integrase